MNEYEFSENNSGGRWWLNREQYDALFAAGWTYEPSDYDKEHGWNTKPWPTGDPSVPYGWRGRLKFKAASIREAVESWEKATKQDFFVLGCTCCGAPFTISGDDGYMSGDLVEHTPVRPF